MADRDLPDSLNLKKLFPSPQFEAWQKEAERLLGSATDAASRSAVETPGFEWRPIFRDQDLSDLPLENWRNSLISDQADWAILQEFPFPDPERFNKELRVGLEHGLSGIYLRLDRAGRLGLDPEQARVGDIGWGGVSVTTADDLAKVIENIPLEKQPILFDCGPSPLVGLGLLNRLAKLREISLDSLTGGLLVDPLGSLATEGVLPCKLAQIFDELAAATEKTASMNRFTVANITAVPYQEAGLTAPEQIGSFLATGVSYLKEMEARSISPEQLQAKLSFTVSVGSNLFVEIAKLRAVRLVWGRLMELAEIPETTPLPQLHVCSLKANRTVHDRHVNLLRGTAESFAAILGGASSLMIAPIDQAHGLPDSFSLRMARNTQLILAEESRLGDIIDPAGGSYYIEKLTDAIAKQAWNKFTEIETMGGMTHALKTGLIHQWVSESIARRSERLTRRKDVIVGTSRYIDLSEKQPKVDTPHLEQLHDLRVKHITNHKNSRSLSSDSLKNVSDIWSSARDKIIEELSTLANDGATIGELSKALRGDIPSAERIGPLTEFKPAEIYEHHRATVKRYETKHGGLPKINLAVIGDQAQLSPRIEFTRDFFAVAGYRTTYNQPYTDIDRAVCEIVSAKPTLVVLIGASKQYIDLVPAFCSSLRDELPETPIALAGYPEEDIDRFRKAGIAEFIYDGMDVHAGLLRLSNVIGVLP